MTKLIDELTVKVEEKILKNEYFNKDWNVNVISDGGVVTLRGAVPSEKHFRLAENITKQIEGVSSVANELSIDPSMKNDDEIAIEKDDFVPPVRQQ